MKRRPFVAVLTVAFVAAAPATAQSQEDAPLVNWSSLLPQVAREYEPTSSDICVSGRIKCVDAVIREMKRRFEPLADSCDHDAIFALSYLRTTEKYHEAVQDPQFFNDTPFVNHEDAVFAAVYFDAFDAWHRGRFTAPAWRVAFEAAKNRELSAAGNLALGINAHVQNDLAFVLAAIGLVRPGGGSRKPDHDKVNQILNRVTAPLLREIEDRFDPTINQDDLPTYVDDVVNFQIIPFWRERAWRNAERLVTAPGAAARALVAADIMAQAGREAELLRAASRYPPGQTSAARDAYCAARAQLN